MMTDFKHNVLIFVSNRNNADMFDTTDLNLVPYTTKKFAP